MECNPDSQVFQTCICHVSFPWHGVSATSLPLLLQAADIFKHGTMYIGRRYRRLDILDKGGSVICHGFWMFVVKSWSASAEGQRLRVRRTERPKPSSGVDRVNRANGVDRINCWSFLRRTCRELRQFPQMPHPRPHRRPMHWVQVFVFVFQYVLIELLPWLADTGSS